jgi:hypothetical protein
MPLTKTPLVAVTLIGYFALSGCDGLPASSEEPQDLNESVGKADNQEGATDRAACPDGEIASFKMIPLEPTLMSKPPAIGYDLGEVKLIPPDESHRLRLDVCISQNNQGRLQSSAQRELEPTPLTDRGTPIAHRPSSPMGRQNFFRK